MVESCQLLDKSNSSQFTVEEAIDHIGFGKFQIKLVLICGLFSATDALEMLLLSVLSPELRCEWKLEDWQVASITTVVFIGMFFGSAVLGSYCDKLGRLPVMKLAAALILYFGLLTAACPNYWWILVIRGLVGFGFGGGIQSFTLLCEYLPSKYRAKILTMYNIMWSSGALFEIFMAYLIIPTLGWRVLVIVSALPSLITLLTIWTLPESARYLLSLGKTKEVLKVLEYIAKSNGSQVPRGTLIYNKKLVRGSFKDLFNKEYFRTTVQLMIVWFGVAFVYYGVILSQSEILEMGGVCGEWKSKQEGCKCSRHHWSDYVSMIVATFGEFVVLPLNFLMVDKIGRRMTIASNFLIAGIFYLLVQICANVTLLTALMFGVRTFITGVFNTIYIYTGEVFPTTVRSFALGSCSAMGRIGCMITPFIAQVLMGFSLQLAIWLYGLLCILCAIVTYCLPIETRGREMPVSFAISKLFNFYMTPLTKTFSSNHTSADTSRGVP
ncbi:hypothetical protein HELRODRAFT_82229 [Helobdella robusta]|uniref:Major facilitator superfamily (MFS) profile domain-containing protein n=1 Tax=Helobdella robusta TaxID=6412 RepID=T1G4P5_HELRO|nr:hypothetical protein HELRODRAFT_82229 [Helobdella robusta]ESO01017.1 hypothetical protein HELRODRAFT_82229 [Helobdella robusta]